MKNIKSIIAWAQADERGRIDPESVSRTRRGAELVLYPDLPIVRVKITLVKRRNKS